MPHRQFPSLLENDVFIVDIKAVTDSGETIQVEVQVQIHEGLARRILYIWAKLYGRANVAGED